MPNEATQTERLSLDEIRERAEEVRSEHESLQLADPISERQIRYYVEKQLLPRAGSRGPGTRYSPKLVWRILFILQLQQYGLSLDHIKTAMRDVSESTMQDVIEGHERLTIASDLSPTDIAHRVDAGEKVVDLEGRTNEYKDSWNTIVEKDRLRIEVRGELNSYQQKLVRQAAALLATAISDSGRRVEGG
jgi:DNA-binding transcriptional MerR regulator